MRRPTLITILLSTLLATRSALANTETLYDSQSGVLPEAPAFGWLYFTLPSVPDAMDTYARLDTTAAASVRGGWTRTANPILSRGDGIRLDFQLRVVGESHSNTNRAGFSVILLDHDRRGIELGFWTDHVWAQSDVPLFVHAEDRAFDTTARMTTYTLVFAGDTYTLAADGAPLLAGAIRDYTAFSGNFDVYETPDFLFLGDDTTSGSASILLESVHLARGPFPKGSPPSLGVVQAGSAVLLHWAAVAGGPDWTLESAPDPANGPWTVDASPRAYDATVGGGSFVARPDASSSGRFYRLR